MIRSMSGYGRSQSLVLGLNISVEIRSVNNRYFDCSIRLPRSLNSLDEPIRTYIKSHISRGKIDVYISLESSAGNVDVKLNHDVLDAYIEAAQIISEEFGLRYDFTVSDVMRMPDVFTLEREKLNEDELTSGVLDAVEAALSELTAMRETEGSLTRDDIMGRVGLMSDHIDSIETRTPQIVSDYRLRLERKMNELLTDSAIEPARIITEAAIFAERLAVDEEIARLRSHAIQTRKLLSGDGEVGRRLDFLIQEMNREINTIGSKISDLDISMIVIELKSQLEKVREQAQNLE